MSMSKQEKLDDEDDHFVRVESGRGLGSNNKLQIKVQVSQVQQDTSNNNDTPEKIDEHTPYHRNSNPIRFTLSHRYMEDKDRWLALEPETLFEKVQTIATNTYVEVIATIISAIAVFHPNWFSLAVAIITQVLFIGIPVQIIHTPKVRLKVYDIASKVMIALTILIIFAKFFVLNDDANETESWGVYYQTNVDVETGQDAVSLDYLGTFLFEIVTLTSYTVIWYVSKVIQTEVVQSQQLNLIPLTFLTNKYFSSKRRIYKYCFVTLTVIEVLSMPDLLGLPVLYSFLVLMIFAIVKVTTKRNRQTYMTSNFFSADGQGGIVNWAMKNERLFQITLRWQKVCMMIQLFEFIITHVFIIRRDIIIANPGSDTNLSIVLFILRCVGHTEYQTAEPLPDLLIAQQMAMTILIIFFGQICEKAYHQFFKNIDSDDDPEFAHLQQARDPMVIRAVNQVSRFFQRRRGVAPDQFYSTFYGFLPVILNWAVRIAVAIFAYMYNSYVGFFHLIWVMLSFLVPLKIFYTVTVVLLFPIVCLEFALVYVANIKTFNNARVYTHKIFDQYQFHPMNLTLEMCLLYTIVVFLGLMIPARLRFLSYDSRHRGSDMTKDMIVRNIKNPDSSVIWKFMFIVLINLHTPVLFLMLFMGNSNFNLFQLGFMFFFVIYGSSQLLYFRTNILLPMFISYFILSQYFWSLVYFKYENYQTNRDFLFLIDGWEPPADINDFYWARIPNLALWGLLFVMFSLHNVSKQFPDKEQNAKYVQECDKHISQQFPTIAKWMKRVWNFLFMLLLVSVLFLNARDLIRQKSNIINLIYLILFTITFGKMCSTSLDGNSYKRCLLFARYIKIYSGFVLIFLVTYHMIAFEYYSLDEWLVEQRQNKNFFVMNIEIFGLSWDQTATKGSVQLYTAYLIVGQILEAFFKSSLKSQEARDLFDWNEVLQTPKGVKKASEYFYFDSLFMVYRFFKFWPVLDFFCTYFHIIANGVIVYFSITVSISLFFAIHLTLIVFFYCYSSYKMHHATKQTGQHDYDIQKATDVCRKYKKLSADIFLRLRKRLWMTQYAITLAFMFAGYLDEIIDTVLQHAEGQTQIDNLKTVQFYMYWMGIYVPNTRERKIEGLQPVHIMFLFILFERQAQNWLYSRWGLNKNLITKFAKLEFFLKLEKKGKEWMPKVEEDDAVVGEATIYCQEIIPKVRHLDELPEFDGSRWLIEQFNTYLIHVWKTVKLASIVKKAIAVGISQKFSKQKYNYEDFDPTNSVLQQLANDEHVDTMSFKELSQLESELSKKLAIDLDLCSHFKKLKLVIEGEECVLYLPVKEIILAQMRKWNLIDMEKVPFLSYSIVSSLRYEVHRSLHFQFLEAAVVYNESKGFNIKARVESEKQDTRLFQLRRELQKIVNRRYSYEMWGGLRLAFEQLSLMLLLINVVIKCNIVSLIYLILVTNYLLRNSKQKAMRNMVYIIASIFIVQYWIYLMNLTSQSSPTPFPQEPYPNEQNPYGQYIIPIMYKFEFGRNMKNAYWCSFGVEIYTVRTLWIDFLTLVLVSIYLFYYRNPVLSTHAESFVWCFKQKNEQSRKLNLPPQYQEDQSDGPKINFTSQLVEYHTLMNQKFPQEQDFGTQSKRLRELKDNCPYYLIAKNAQVLVFTTMHIFTMIVILLMALCRRSFISLGYVIVLAPCLLSSATVLKQHENYILCENELKTTQQLPEFRELLTEQQKQRIIQSIKRKYEWSFIRLICVYLSIYSYFDFVTQVTFQVPYIPNYPILEHFGLRKIYPPHPDSFDYTAFISGHYDAPSLNFSNLLMQILNCIIVCTISTQSQLFKSKGYKAFVLKPNYGLDLLMKLAQLKKLAITYGYNNSKMTKIIALQKTEQQIFGCVARIKVNMDMWRKSQQRAMLEEYCRTYGGFYISPDPQPPVEQQPIDRPNAEQDQEKQRKPQLNPLKKLSKAIQDEKQRREKLISEQIIFVTQQVLPYRAKIYLWLMYLSQSYIFVHRSRDMLRILNDMEFGRQNTGIDLLRVIRSDLQAIMKRYESEKGVQLSEWPKLKIDDLRNTNIYCKWSNIISRQWAAVFRAIISNTALISYACMVMSLYTNAGIVALIYPFAVFGYALLEETRPNKGFWRFMLTYSLSVLFLKYVVNLNLVHVTLSNTNFPLIDGFIKFGLHHLESTKDLVRHMLPEMLIVTSILCHEIVEQFTGLYDKCESEVENVPQAIDRIFGKYRDKTDVSSSEKNRYNQSGSAQRKLSSVFVNEYKQNQSNSPNKNQIQSSSEQEVVTFLSRASNYESEKRILIDIETTGKSDEKQIELGTTSEVQNKLASKLKQIKSLEELNADQKDQYMVFDDDKQRIFEDDYFKRQSSQLRTTNQSGSTLLRSSKKNSTNDTLIDQSKESNSFWDGEYMKRIFPRIQQQKPGNDYYGWCTVVQIYLCYFLLNNFSIFSAIGPYYEKNIFPAEMTIVLFYQIFVIILERYIARTENRKQIQKHKRTAEAIKPTIKEEELFLPLKHNEYTVNMVVQNLKFQDLADKQHIEALSNLRHQQECDIVLSEYVLTRQQKLKYILHLLNLIIVHGYIFWYLPISANISLYGEPNCGVNQIYGCKDFRVNPALQDFYKWYLLYFFLSSRQISQGLPSFRRGSSTMYYEGSDINTDEEDIANAWHQVFINFPLAVEMRCLLDFTFTRTSIDLWQNCQLFQYNSDFFIAKTSNRSYNRRVIGSDVTVTSKFCFGYVCTTIMLSFILGPFIMFSSLGGMTVYNPVRDNDLQLWIQVNVTTTRIDGSGDGQINATDSQIIPFKLYDNESPSIYDFDESMFTKRKFDEWPETKFFEPGQLQLIVPTYYSDTTWIASDSTRAFLQKYSCLANIRSISDEAVPQLCEIHKNVTNVQNVSIGFQLRHLFNREGPTGAKDASGIQQRNLNTDDAYDRVLLSQLSAIMTENCTTYPPISYTLNITNFFYPKLLLGETTSVEPIFFSTRETLEEAKKNILLTYKCKDQWAVGTGSSNDESSALEFTIFSQRIQVSWLQGYDIGAFYTGVVLIIGMYMRPIFIFNTNRAFIYETNYPDPMLRLCESIHLCRSRGDNKMEEENFRLLQDILRSPELLHVLTGSNMKGGVAPSADEQRSHLIPRAYN